MITLILLFSLFCKSTQEGNGQENGVLQCGPQKLTVSSSEQMILLTWEDDASCSAVRDGLIYELVVLIADKQVHYEEVAVTPDQIGSTHSWNWTSYLALECVSHSVKLRSRYKDHTSPWKQGQTLLEIKNPKQPEVFPRDRLFKVGSTVTFCCVLPARGTFNRSYLAGCDDCNMNTTKISNQVYTLTAHLSQPSTNSCTDVVCETETTDYGACAYIGYPPDDRDLQCETRDLESVDCHWTVGRNTHLSSKSPTDYQLLGRPCAQGSPGSCSQKEQVDVGDRNWTVTATNNLGKVELVDNADLTKRVHMFAPERVTVSTVNARNVRLEWEWTLQQYNNLNITCQVNISHGESHTLSENFGVGLHFAVLNDLIPHWTYNVTVRCGTAQHFWKWSDWSTCVNFRTREDVPDALDVWMQVKDNEILIIWKEPLANQSHGHIESYEVSWAKTTERQQQTRATVKNNHRLPLSLNISEEYIVEVRAWNRNGSSAPSAIIIPSLSPDRTERVNTSWITGSNGSFNLTWSASPAASCGYIVDWCPTLKNCSVEWLKVPPNKTSANIFSKNFIDGVRSSLSVYACTQEAPVLLERREGYVSERRIKDGLFKPLKHKQRDSDVEVSWDSINLREQSAFIRGYVLYCLDKDSNIIRNVRTDDPEASSLTARNLDIGSYTFQVKALTVVGECGTTTITTTLNTSDNLIKPVFISLVTVFGLLSLFIAILCYRHWTWIKLKVYPPIPKPVLTEWSLGGDSCRPLQHHPSEADIMDVPELHCVLGALVNGYVSQENKLCDFTQTPEGYYNQPLNKYSQLPLTLPSTAIPSQSGLSSSPFRSVFPNPSYNLIIQTGDQQSKPDPDLQEGTHLMKSFSGYQPQNNKQSLTVNQTAEDNDTPISCVFDYMLLPQSPSQ